ncbi:30S ribosomal protein S19 [candidate division WWE3 bacterium CG08_land_8_20_14_0_20_43_13]|uniref:Small ribosomal subunit protein uS19 n=1 Tax=candidate division WWE3 bacterium CG08_land_8_20_14_0_20_43_13 TaxID=1975087 RepID=A0A2H0X796_UNCKA|nr:MAG: 30S ribosomal protein S19 [candidate division WWE3 bacterium CG08_land_8_20_14_0_20_43_13]
MSRSSKKGPYTNEKLLIKVRRAEESGSRQVIKTWFRSSVITPEMVGHTFGVHNGKLHVNVFVTEAMIGHRLGEFALTRIFRAHGGRKDTADKKPAD